MVEQVSTKWYRILEAVKNGKVGLISGARTGGGGPTWNPDGRFMSPKDLEDMRAVVHEYDSYPRFFIDDLAMNLVKSGEHIDTLEIMFNEGLTKLPFPEMLVEFDLKQGDTVERLFVVIRERAGDKGGLDNLRKTVVDYESPDKYPWEVSILKYKRVDGGDVAVFSPMLLWVGMSDNVDQGGFGFIYSGGPHSFALHGSVGDIVKMMKARSGIDGKRASLGLSAVMALLSTRGVEGYKAPLPKKFNKLRRKGGKTEVSAYTVIRIGEVYSRNGSAVNCIGGRSPAKVHWRRGHNRRVHYGPKKSLTKTVFVKPVLVNYSGDDLVTPKFVVKGRKNAKT